jgi:hypothetical protein
MEDNIEEIVHSDINKNKEQLKLQTSRTLEHDQKTKPKNPWYSIRS